MEGNRRFHLVTFDLDGTMLNDEWAHAEANWRIGAKLGIDCTALGDMTGYSVRTRWQALCRQADVTADVEEIARDHFRITLEIIRQARIPESAGLKSVRIKLFRKATSSMICFRIRIHRKKKKICREQCWR